MSSLSRPAALAACQSDALIARQESAPRVDVRPSAIERLVRTLILWHHRSRSRAALRTLDDRLLRDIGLDRDTAQCVAAKRFWQD